MRGRGRRGIPTVPLVLAVVASLLVLPAGSAAARETVPCASVRLEPGARVSGEELADCLRFRMEYAARYRTRIAATGDATTTADVVLDPLGVRARRGSEHVVVGEGGRTDDTLFAMFVRHAAPPGQLVGAARSVAWWTVVRATRADDADGRSSPVVRLEPLRRARFDGTSATRVSLHLGDDLLPVRFRATTTAVGIAVTYTQRWSRWGARLFVGAPLS